jgi:hypothetical protein
VVRQGHRQLTRITERHFPKKIQEEKRKKCVVFPSSHERFREKAFDKLYGNAMITHK